MAKDAIPFVNDRRTQIENMGIQQVSGKSAMM